MILVDTSVWIDHLRRGDAALATALDAGNVLMHPFVIGELACGNLKNRAALFALLLQLPVAPMATDAEALDYIDRYRLMGRGIGYLDMHLLAATALAPGAKLWTRDKRLASVAGELKLAFETAKS
ncbi:MAG: type II toxin-antitoxin system VapC family toxin [Rhodanobacteraceae bacterium]